MAEENMEEKRVTGGALRAALDAVSVRVARAGDVQPKAKDWANVTAENFSKISVGDTVNGGIVSYKNLSSLEVQSVGGGSWYLKNGETVSRHDHSGIMWDASIDRNNYLTGVWGMMPIGVVGDEHDYSYGFLYGTDSSVTEGYYVLRGRTVTRYQMTNDNGEYRGVPEATFRIPRIWPDMTLETLAALENFNQFEIGDIIGREMVLFRNTNSLIINQYGIFMIQYDLLGNQKMRVRHFSLNHTSSETMISAASDPEEAGDGSAEENSGIE